MGRGQFKADVDQVAQQLRQFGKDGIARTMELSQELKRVDASVADHCRACALALDDFRTQAESQSQVDAADVRAALEANGRPPKRWRKGSDCCWTTSTRSLRSRDNGTLASNSA